MVGHEKSGHEGEKNKEEFKDKIKILFFFFVFSFMGEKLGYQLLQDSLPYFCIVFF